MTVPVVGVRDERKHVDEKFVQVQMAMFDTRHHLGVLVPHVSI